MSNRDIRKFSKKFLINSCKNNCFVNPLKSYVSSKKRQGDILQLILFSKTFPIKMNVDIKTHNIFPLILTLTSQQSLLNKTISFVNDELFYCHLIIF